MELHLAPLENVSCWALRKLCVGATDSYTGMLVLSDLLRRDITWNEVDTYAIEGQRQWIQVATAKEAECAAFIARLRKELEEHPEKDHVHGVQINASCPSPNLIRAGQGPALIKRATKVCSLLKELLKQDTFKVGIKVRLGLNETEVQQRKIITLFEEMERIGDPNLGRITVHFKHAKDRSSTPYEYAMIDELKTFKLPVIINGGFRTFEECAKVMKGAPRSIVGVMVGRGALENPDVFNDLSRNFNAVSVPARTMRQISERFRALCAEHPPKENYLEKIKMHCDWAH